MISMPSGEDIESIVGWADESLSSAQQGKLADSIETMIDHKPTRPDADAMLDIVEAVRQLAEP